MMYARTKNLLAFALCLPLLAGGCALLQPFLSGQKPELTFRDVKLTGWALDKVDLELVYELRNPYDVPLTLKEVTYQLEVEGRRLLSGAPKEGLTIRKKSTQILRFPATVHFLDAVPVITQLFSKDALSYRASGRLGVDTPLGVVPLPLSHSGGIEVPKLPRVEITGLSAPRMDGANLELSLGLKLHNPNDFPIPLEAFAWKLEVDRSSLASGTAKPGAITKKGSRSLSIPMRVGLGQAMQKLVSGQASEVSLTSSFKSGKMDVPLNASQLLKLAR